MKSFGHICILVTRLAGVEIIFACFLKRNLSSSFFMPVLKIHSDVKQVDIESALNGELLDADEFAEVERYCNTIRSKIRTAYDAFRRPEDLVKKVRETETWLRRIVTTRLRLLVDEWLDSGIDSTGAEVLEERSMLKAPRATQVLRDYALKRRPPLLFFPKISEFIVSVGDPDDEEQDEELSRTHFYIRYRIDRAWGEAARLFTGLMMSDWGLRLCKCRYPPCGRYFVIDKPRHAYKRGTFCRKTHQACASAAILTAKRRSDAKAGLVELAAKWLAKKNTGRDWPYDKVLKMDLRDFLNNEMGRRPDLRAGREHVKVNFVTRHRAEIEQRRLGLTKQVKHVLRR